MKRESKAYSLAAAALLLAAGLILPFFLGQVQVLTQSISPMHIPAYIAGLTLGPVYGLAVGALTPLLRMLIFGMPPVAAAVPMAFELAVYGLVCGLLYPAFCRKNHLPAILAAMLCAMVLGRLAGGTAKAVFMGLNGNAYGFSAFVSAYFVGTAVGAVIHLILCPAVTLALEKAGLSPLGAKLP